MTRTALYVLIGSVVISALLGIYALLADDFGEVEGKLLMTSLCISGASILALACGAAWGKVQPEGLPLAGLVLSVLGFAGFVFTIWTEAWDWPSGETLMKAIGSILTIGTAAAYVCVAQLARLAPRFAWATAGAIGLTVLLALLIVGVIWWGDPPEDTWRWLMALGILVLGFTILLPVFRKMGRGELAADTLEGGSGRIRFCPHCGEGMDRPEGRVRCGACGARFRVGSEEG